MDVDVVDVDVVDVDVVDVDAVDMSAMDVDAVQYVVKSVRNTRIYITFALSPDLVLSTGMLSFTPI